jgi:hypothetical protein
MSNLLGKSHAALHRAAKYHHDCGDNKEFFPASKLRNMLAKEARNKAAPCCLDIRLATQ